MTALGRLWRGETPLRLTFWLAWAVPVVGGYVFLSKAQRWIIVNVGLVTFHGCVLLLVLYCLWIAVPLWRSSGNYTGPKPLRYGARGVAGLSVAFTVFGVAAVVVSLFAIRTGQDSTHDPTREAERTAIPSASHPMAGFWKQGCDQDFGLAIAPAGGGMYSVSFCGPGGCFKPGTYRPNTPLVGDEAYEIVGLDTLKVYGHFGWSTYSRSFGRNVHGCPPPSRALTTRSSGPRALRARFPRSLYSLGAADRGH